MMQKRIFGVFLILLGTAGLILAVYYLVLGDTVSSHSTRSTVIYSILGLVFFFGGIGEIRNTRNLSNRN